MARKPKRKCDVANSPQELVKAFVEHCNCCEQGCPMGCIRRRGEIIGLLDSDSWKCGNIHKKCVKIDATSLVSHVN